jgi:acetolactate synthase-1/2/3 large subunit
VLLIGNGVRLSKAIKEVLSLVERLQIPVLLTWPALDMLPETDDLLVGRPGPVAPRGANFALQNSDLLISLGARLDTVVTGYSHNNFARGAKKVMVDIDPAEINKMQTKIDVPICADAKAVILEMLQQSSRILSNERKSWREKCHEWKNEYPVMLPKYRQEKLVSAYLFTDVLSEELQENEIVIPCSSGAGIEIFLLAYKAKKGQRVLNTTALGAMGNGLPASIGACLACGRKRTICIDADGGIQFNIQEFATIVQLKLPIKIFVLNNQGYSSIRTSQLRYFNRLTGADKSSGLELPDICKVAEAYGFPTRRITESKDLADKIKEVLALPGVVVCEVLTPPDEPRAPSMMSVQKPGGGMISKPLEDLWPFLDRQEFLSNMIIPPIEE